jgi:hypothetical protein
MRRGSTFALVPLLLCLGLAAPRAGLAGSWSLPDASRGSRVAPLLLLSRPEVRDDLRLAPDQVAEAEKAVAALREQAAALRGQTGEAVLTGRRAVDEGQKTWLQEHLTPDQVDRLWQVDLLWEGPAAMATRPGVADDLGLSDEQKAALRVALAERNARRDQTGDVAGANRQFGERALVVLSDAQKKRWTEMVGRPIAAKGAAPTPTTTVTATVDR